MEPEFWQSRWESNEIGFHRSEANALLVAHFEALALPPRGRVFVPLCGKTLDIGWLLARGCRIAGAELSEIAIGQLFDELGVEPEITELGELKRYSASDIDIFVGDIFKLDRATLGPVDAVYDRGALIALPQDMRSRYAPHIAATTADAPQLIVAYAYDQELHAGPPFSVPEVEVRRLYDGAYDITLLASIDDTRIRRTVPGAVEQAWLLSPR